MRRVAIVSTSAFALLGLAAGGTSHEGRRADVTFVGEILPLLQKQGCASAYCHGSATGRAGFKLSLFGSDAEADHAAIVHDLGARRVDLRRPEESLLLRKPALRTKHGGGRRLPEDSEAYRIFAKWVADGAPFGPAPRAGLRSTVSGDGFRVSRGAEDVTHLAIASSTDESVVAVDASGRLTRRGPGAAWIVARVGSAQTTAGVVNPFGERRTPSAATAIDAAWLAALGELGLAAPPRAAAHTLVRRLHLDLVGRVPTPAELTAFLTLPPETRVKRTVERLVASDAFAATFGGHLARWLEIPASDTGLRSRVRAAVAGQEGLFALVDGLVTSRRWLERREDPRDRAELFARTLLGVRIGCARCHDSPLDRWTRAEHLGFSACFAGPGRLFDPESGVAVAPRPLALDGAAMPAAEHAATATPRTTLAAARPWVARNLANRAFAELFGRGLVHPVDDHRATNPTWFEALLALLAHRLEATDGDLRALVAELASSELYAQASEPTTVTTDEDRTRLTRWLAVRDARELAPEALVQAVGSALGVPLAHVTLPDEALARELALLNGSWLDEAIARSDLPALEVAAIFERILSRPPNAAEAAAFAGTERRGLVFALLASREFRSVR